MLGAPSSLSLTGFDFLEGGLQNQSGLTVLLLAAAAAVLCTCCGACWFCGIWRLRDIKCMNWLLMRVGFDVFEDFDLVVHVHEVTYKAAKKLKLRVRLTAGQEAVTTSKSSKGSFQVSLHMLVRQGTQYLIVEVISESEVVLAQHKLHIDLDILQQRRVQDKLFNMKPKFRALNNPAVRLTLQCCRVNDVEEGILSSRDPEVVKQRDQRDKPDWSKDWSNTNDTEALSRACRGPVEVFGSFGNTTKRFVGIEGSPGAQRFVLGIWNDEHECEARLDAQLEVDILRIESVQADPGRFDVFVVHYFDHRGVSRKLTCRIIDRPAKMWVEMLHNVITRAREVGKVHKKPSKMRGESSLKQSSSPSRGTGRD